MNGGFRGVQEFFMTLPSLYEELAAVNQHKDVEQFAIARVRYPDSEDNLLWVLSYPMQEEERTA